MKKFGMYDSSSKTVVCHPIEYYAQLRDILERNGLPGSEVTFTGPQKVQHLWVLPGTDEQPPPPKELGYSGVLTQWAADEKKMVRTIEWQPANFSTFTEQLSAHISKQQESALGVLEIGYTEREVKSWPQQRAEAAEYSLDDAKEVPLLAGMAARRGIPLAAFVGYVQAKVKATADLTAIILGDAQAANDQIEALQALDETENLPADWFEQLTDIAENWRKSWPEELLESQ